jgi:hypothetical protein
MATYVVQVAESVNVENIREAGSKAKILEEAGEHVPGVTLEMTSFMPADGGSEKILT